MTMPVVVSIAEGARDVSSSVMRSPMPENIAVPPESTAVAWRSFQMSTPHFMMEWKVVSRMPLAFLPTKLGRKSTSAQ